MARKKKELSEVSKRRARSFRSRERRQQRRKKEADPTDLSWLLRIGIRMAAARILNETRDRPYWLSISHDKEDGVPPVSDFFPCSQYRTKSRVYYGFLFREHRDAQAKLWDNARKELTSNIDVSG